MAHRTAESDASTMTPTLIRKRFWALFAVLFLVFSPSVAGWLSQWMEREQLKRNSFPPSLVNKILATPAQKLATPNSALLHQYSQNVAFYQHILTERQISEKRQISLLEGYWRVYQQAYILLGAAQANTLMHLINLESENQAKINAKFSAFPNLEAPLASSVRWLNFISRVLTRSKQIDPIYWSPMISTLAPLPMDPEAVLNNAQWIQRAANANHLPVGPLAAIVDNEQAGANTLYGLAGYLRNFTDLAALRSAELYGNGGLEGRLSRTIGISQMSWQDAILQTPRLKVLNISFGVPYPTTEAQARNLLMKPAANLMFTGSRLRGYLNAAYKKPSLSTQPFTDAWIYYLAPAWHNKPVLAKEKATWSYAWNAFFKSALYQTLVPRYLSYTKKQNKNTIFENFNLNLQKK